MGKFTVVNIGDKFFHLTITDIYEHVPNTKRQVRVVCDCGTEFDMPLGSLTLAWRKSCGCFKDENRRRLKEDDIIGTVFGNLTVMYEAEPRGKKNERYFHCRCECGKEKDIALRHLRSGKTISCRCLAKNNALKHGLKKNGLYGVWSKIKSRCYNKDNKAYSFYGERGISMCDEWIYSPESFVEWALASGYKKGLTIDRIDNDGNYTPLNCRWVDMTIQSNNRRDNKRYPYKGKLMTIPEICRETDLNDYRYMLYHEIAKMKRDIPAVIAKYTLIHNNR